MAIALGFMAAGFLASVLLFVSGGRARVSKLLVRGASVWKSADEEVEQNQHRYRHLVEYSPGLICTHTLNGILLSVNPAAARSLGYSPQQMLGRSLADFVDQPTRLLMNGYLRRISTHGRDESFIPVMTKSGERRVWQCNSIIYEDGNEPYVIGYAQDVTELMRARDELKRLVVTDELTGLHNRRGFFTLAEHLLKTAKREGKSCLLICADIDGLKWVNDSLGHPVGSELLVDTAQILRAVFRESDVVARIGGDEFAILALDNDASKAPIVLSRLQAQVDAFNNGDHRYKISLSAGIACFTPEIPIDVQELLRTADEKMYEHKRRTRTGLKLETA
ncbi:MAG: sensor domain-containing diguanylate cyclase [Gemmatimonadota bacterium]|nr:sensor domain-containing diguanylate cyclase [Gemmatimonadota bacterium]